MEKLHVELIMYIIILVGISTRDRESQGRIISVTRRIQKVETDIFS